MEGITQADYERAMHLNDEAHQKTIVQVCGGDTMERQEIFKEISREARMWLDELKWLRYGKF